jgi:hypothetical protein
MNEREKAMGQAALVNVDQIVTITIDAETSVTGRLLGMEYRPGDTITLNMAGSTIRRDGTFLLDIDRVGRIVLPMSEAATITRQEPPPGDLPA